MEFLPTLSCGKIAPFHSKNFMRLFLVPGILVAKVLATLVLSHGHFQICLLFFPYSSIDRFVNCFVMFGSNSHRVFFLFMSENDHENFRAC